MVATVRAWCLGYRILKLVPRWVSYINVLWGHAGKLLYFGGVNELHLIKLVMTSHLIFVTETALLVEHFLHRTQTPQLSNIYTSIMEHQYHVLSKLLQTPNAMCFPNYCRLPMPCVIQINADSQCHVLSKLLQIPNATYYPNYCRPPMPCIIQITADPNAMYYPNYCRPPMQCIILISAHSQCHVLSKLLQTHNAMYYSNYCRTPMPCIVQITADSQCHVLSKLLQTPMPCIIKFTADPNAMYYPNYCRPPIERILQITANYTLIQ
jgi:hypothetical protein